MGKARITDNHGAGLYTIEIIEARERAESAKLQAESRITSYQAEIVELEMKISAAQNGINAAVIKQDNAVNQYQDDMINTGSSNVQLTMYAEDVLKAVRSRDLLIAKKRTNEIRTLSDQALVDRVNALPPLRQIQAWCADYVEDLSGDVATAEVPGEIGSVIIKPGFDGNIWSASDDGAMQPALASTPAGAFYNLAMMPGWQKWRPTFRIATISNIVGDTCSIALDPAASSQQGLDVNAQNSYSNVPIMYMDCNGEAFEDGDVVLVAFAGNVNTPLVVGFAESPRQCCTPEVLGESPDDDTWEVQSQFGALPISGGGSVAWRIVDSDTGYVLFTGGVVQHTDGEHRLDALPESILLEETTAWQHEIIDTATTTVTSSNWSGDYWTTLASPVLAAYADGRFGVEVSRTPVNERDLSEPPPLSYAPRHWYIGYMLADGTLVETSGAWDPIGELRYDDWIAGHTYHAAMVYWQMSSIRQRLRLEKGCGSRWPV